MASKFVKRKLPAKASSNKVGTYQLVKKFAGYLARTDPTTIGPSYLVSPSQNVVTNTSGRVALVKGYTIDGGASSNADSGILSHYDFTPSSGVQNVRNMRAGFLTTGSANGKLQYRFVDALGVVSWKDLKTNLGNVRLSFCDFSDTYELKKLCLWVDGTNSIYQWNGAVTTFASASNASGWISSIISTPTNGGVGYLAGDVITLTGGTATATVVATNQGTVAGASISYGGSGYTNGDVLTLYSSTGDPALGAIVTVTSVAVGVITGITVTTGGVNYYVGNARRATGGTGTGAIFQVTTISSTITSLSLTTNGSGYAITLANATTGGTGTGCTVNISFVANNAILKQGTNTILQDGFYSTRNKQIVINGVTYAYQGGETSNAFVGISPDPTLGGYIAGTSIHQLPVTYPLTSMTSINNTFAPTVIGCGKQNQVYLGNINSNSVYVSMADNYTNYTFSANRKGGDGWLFQCDAPPTKFIAQEVINQANSYDMWISEGLHGWSIIRTTTSITDTASYEKLERIRLKIAPLQGSKSERLAIKMKNHIAFVGNDNVVNMMGFVSDKFVPSMQDQSYSIVDDQNSYDMTDGSLFYYKNYLYETVPKSSLIRIYNMTDQTKENYSIRDPIEQVDASQPWYWEAPVTYPISGFYVAADGQLYGHSYVTSESYKLFNGGNFNGQQISANATFGFDDKGDRTTTKLSSELWVEGYIKQNTILSCIVSGDLGSFVSSQTQFVNGNDSGLVSYGSGGHALGKNNLGSQPLGGAGVIATALPAWFHAILTFGQANFYLEQVSFATSGYDLQWELICFGTDAMETAEGNNDLNR